MKALSRNITTLRKQVDERVEGILRGLRAQSAAQTATADTISKQVAEQRRRDVERATSYRPYLRAKRDLEILEKVRDTLMQQLLEKQYGGPHPAVRAR